MNKITFDSGIQEYRLNGNGVLRFNPGDPNLYARFLEAADKIRVMEQQLMEKAEKTQASAQDAILLLQEADRQMKATLSWVFGADNDFDKLLGGINLLAVAANGERVVTNLFAALQPVLVTGAEKVAKQQTQAAVDKAKARRAAQ